MASIGEPSGWLAVILFTLMLAWGVIGVIRPDQLAIDGEGFAFCSYPFRSKGTKHRWEDVTAFQVSAGGKGGPDVSFGLTSNPKLRQGGIRGYGLSADESPQLLNERRSIALSESLEAEQDKPESPAAELTAAELSSVGPRSDLSTLYFEFPSDRRPPVAGSFVPIGRSLVSARQIARRLGEPIVAGTVVNNEMRACVMLTADVGPIVFVSAGIGSRVFAKASADHDLAYSLAKTVTHGKIRRIR